MYISVNLFIHNSVFKIFSFSELLCRHNTILVVLYITDNYYGYNSF